MKTLFRTLGMAALTVALLNASAGLCFCHRGPIVPGADEASGGCCHGANTSQTTALSAAPDCCRVESTQRRAEPTAATQFPPPVAHIIPVDAWLAAAPATVGTRALPAASPPLLELRI